MIATGTKQDRVRAIAEKLRERSDELSNMGCRIEDTDGDKASQLQEAAQHLDDAAYILEEIKLP